MKKTSKAVAFLFFSFSTHFVFSQDKALTFELEELIIEQQRVSNRSKSQRVVTFNDSILNQTSGTFTDFLQKNTTIYFKENGAGMVSSPSFRGTTAQQTSVLWNGIKVNSNLLGQSDFNSTSFKNYDAISVKAGGGSVLYGSGAIGGTIHLNNSFTFNQPLNQTLQLGYGSFNNQDIHYKIKAGTERLAMNAHVGFTKNDNDYLWQKQNRKNINGAYHNINFGSEIAYKINSKHQIEYFSSFYNDERHFALLTPYQTKTKYLNTFTRNLAKWHYKNQNWLNTLYLSNIQEAYTYFDLLPTDQFSGGKSNMWLFKNETFYKINNRFKISSLIDFQTTNAIGNNTYLPKTNQQIGAVALQAYYDWNNQGLEIGLKNEFAKDYQNPFLFSAGYFYTSSFYDLKVNGSKNYRIPTFNDLYWQPGGSLDLKPETSYQFDINQTLKIKQFQLNVSSYYLSITNMLRWLPTNSGIWKAANTDKVTVKGAEITTSYNKNYKQHQLHLHANFAYNLATNGNNKQLTYSPKFKANGSVSYSYKDFTFSPLISYTGKVFTTESNTLDSTLKGYTLIDVTLSKQIFKQTFPFTIAFQLKNIGNKAYYSMPEREMPGANYHISLTKKF